MRVYTQIIKYIGIAYIIIGGAFTIAAYIFPHEFLAGETMNTIGFIFSMYAFWFLVVLGGIYWLIYRPDYEVVTKFKKVQAVTYSIMLINLVFTLFFLNDKLENGLTTASSKLMTFLATTIMLGYFVYVGANNILKIDTSNKINLDDDND